MESTIYAPIEQYSTYTMVESETFGFQTSDLTTSLQQTFLQTERPEYNIPPLVERIIEAILLTCICFVAVTGNVLLWIVIFRRRSLRTTSNALILCLSSADILVSAVNMPLTIFTVLAGSWQFGSILCTLQGMFNMTTFIGSVMSLGAISINRYILIVHPHKFRKVYTTKKTGYIIAGVWCLSVFLASPPLLGWADYGYLPGQSFCFCNWRESVSYTFFMVVICFGSPCSIMTFCYYKILKAFRTSQQKFNQSVKEPGGTHGSAKDNCYNRKQEDGVNKINPRQSKGRQSVDKNENSKDEKLTRQMNSLNGRQQRTSLASGVGHVASLNKLFQRQNSPSNVHLVERKELDPADDIDNDDKMSISSDSQSDSKGNEQKSNGKLENNVNGINKKKGKRKMIKWKTPFKTKEKVTVNESTIYPDQISTDDFSNPFVVSVSVTGVANGERVSVLGRSNMMIRSNASRIAKKKKRREEEMRLTKSFIVVIFVFIICWFPFCITMFWSVFAKKENSVPRVIDMTSLLLGYANSCCNPIIYGVMNKKFRAGFRALLCWFKEKNMVTPAGTIRPQESSQA